MYLAPLNFNRFFGRVFSEKKIAKGFLEDFLDIEFETFETLGETRQVADDAAVVEFVYRCKINGAYVIIDLQQWYKPDIFQRSYLYHASKTGAQLEEFSQKKQVLGGRLLERKKVNDCKSPEPVITLMWLAVGSLGFEGDYASYRLTPEAVVYFITNKKLWHNPRCLEALKERDGVLETLKGDVENLGFWAQNRLIYLFQKNIVQNKALKKYERWFQLAEKTRDENNREEDFKCFAGEELFGEIIRRLNRTELSEEDIRYIEEEKVFWEEVERLERGIYEDGFKEGLKEARTERGEQKVLDIARKLLELNVPLDAIATATGLSPEVIKKLV